MSVVLIACGPPRAEGEGEAEAGSEADSGGSAEMSATGDTADTLTGPDSAESGESGEDPCGPEALLCPDGNCHPLDDWPCCGAGGECPGCGPSEQLCPDRSCQPAGPGGCCEHGGECLMPGCESEDAQTGPDPCVSDPVYAWDGKACYEVIACACVGSDCPNLPAEPLECLADKAECLFSSLDDCPYALAIIDIEGTVMGQPWAASHASFAQIVGEGPALLELVLAPDELTLVNSLFAQQIGERLVKVSFLEGLGMIDASARVGGGFEPPASAAAVVTISGLELGAPSFAERFVAGSLDVVAEGWDLHGEFMIYGCQALYQALP